jgi:hypothetical protein
VTDIKVTKQFLEMHKYAARLDAFILTGNTLKILLDRTKTTTQWLAHKLDASEKVVVDLMKLEDIALSRILTVSILDALKARFNTRGKLLKLDTP